MLEGANHKSESDYRTNKPSTIVFHHSKETEASNHEASENLSDDIIDSLIQHNPLVTEESAEILDQLPAEAKQFIASIEMHSSGPLPHPSILEGYEKVEPGSANRIISMTENQMEHRFEMESRRHDIYEQGEKRGSILAFIVTIGGLILIAYLGHLEQTFMGVGSLILALASLAGIFFFRFRDSEKPEQIEKKRENSENDEDQRQMNSN